MSFHSLFVQKSALKAMMAQSSRSLAAVEEALNGWVKPKVFGESWDNIGLLVGSGRWPRKEDKIISGILVCNDLKPAVVDEAIGRNANLIIAYHPPIFSGMKSVTYGSWKVFKGQSSELVVEVEN
jgi:putative NIF3 family GTP cyclohydrolase 1 type 2